MGLFNRNKKEEKTSCCCGGSSTPEAMAQAEVMDAEKLTIRELADGGCKLSVRTSGGLNATKVCAILGGGGHAAAAGCTVDMGLKEAEEQILAAIRQVERDG